MGSVGVPEVMLVLLVMLILLGPEQLPKAAQGLGKAVHEFRRITGGFDAEVRAVIQEVMGPLSQVAGGVGGVGGAITGGILGTLAGTGGAQTSGAQGVGPTGGTAGDATSWAVGSQSATSEAHPGAVPVRVLPVDPSLN